MMQPRIVVSYSYYANLIAITSYRVAGSTDSRSAMQMVLIQYCRLGYQMVGRLLKLGLNHNDGVCRVRCSRLPAAHTGDQLELAGFVSG